MGKGIKMRSAKDWRGYRHTIKDLQALVEDGGAAPPLCVVKDAFSKIQTADRYLSTG